MMWGYGYGTPSAGMTTWMIISSILWLVIVGIAVWALVRWLTAHRPASSQTPSSAAASPSALEILRQRYARGEIDEPTFERMHTRLTAALPGETREEATASGRRLG